MSIELKPCPFCGGAASKSAYDRGITIGCDPCGYSRHFPGLLQTVPNDKPIAQYRNGAGGITEILPSEATEFYHADANERAADAWNNRAGVQAAPEEAQDALPPIAKTKTNSYTLWTNMRQRCENVNHANYLRYGGRGITVCKRWLKYENFIEDMGVRPEGKTLDRIDGNKGYSKENCRWASVTEQNRNKRTNKLITHKGVTKCLSEWAKDLGICDASLRHRLNQGWVLEDALTHPKAPGRRASKVSPDATNKGEAA